MAHEAATALPTSTAFPSFPKVTRRPSRSRTALSHIGLVGQPEGNSLLTTPA